MKATLLIILFCAAPLPALAEDCPDYYRFVDFGQKGADGVTYRGGPILRAESLAGSPLLIDGQTQCVTVPSRASDGHGNPIPVVTSITYDPARTGLDLTELRISHSDNAATAASQSADLHRAILAAGHAVQTRGPDYLCAADIASRAFSCQVASPYDSAYDLVIYCDETGCRAPAIALQNDLVATVGWPAMTGPDPAPQSSAETLITQVQELVSFLATLR
ncbi:hypothetical protein [Yoonia sp. BS5-3]|uniref:Uncharacterized protein n=1 Tax=Yoonia phaeophyticola TaxID=3137369 RepID=A0ABZ2V8V0_9RHOB